MVEVREVLRGWLEGLGLQTVTERSGVDRKTVGDTSTLRWLRACVGMLGSTP